SSAIGPTMIASSRPDLPFRPLLHAYAAGLPAWDELGGLPVLGPRFRAVQEARQGLLAEAFLDGVGDAAWQAALLSFYEACVRPPLHADTLCRRAGIVRHAVAHLRRCPDPLPRKLERCLAAGGDYHVAGLGPSFWSALVQGLDASPYPAWTDAVAAGLRR